jgi:hypothetical protein
MPTSVSRRALLKRREPTRDRYFEMVGAATHSQAALLQCRSLCYRLSYDLRLVRDVLQMFVHALCGSSDRRALIAERRVIIPPCLIIVFE